MIYETTPAKYLDVDEGVRLQQHEEQLLNRMERVLFIPTSDGDLVGTGWRGDAALVNEFNRLHAEVKELRIMKMKKEIEQLKKKMKEEEEQEKGGE